MVSALRVTWCRWEPGKRLALRTVYAAGWGLGGGFPPHSPGERVYNNLEGLGHAWDRLADSLRKPAPPSPPPFLTTARRRAPVGELHPAFLALVATVLALRILPEKSSEKMPGMESHTRSAPRSPGTRSQRQAVRGRRWERLGGAGVPPRPGQASGRRRRGGSEWPRQWAVPESPPFGRLQACSSSVAVTMASQQLFRALVSAQWVAEALRAPLAGQPLQLLDASWYLPKLGRDARCEFEERHIPGAAFFDIDQCSDRTSPYDHMLPSAADFAEYASRLGVGAGTHVVIYDASDQGLYSAPRVWWMFRAFGHRTVSLLNGGLRHWLRQGLPLSSGKSHPAPAVFCAVLDPAFIKTYDDIRENLESRRFQVVDARAAGRFRGTEPEPRDGIEPGHIPGTVNIPFTEFLTEEGLEKSPEEIHQLFKDKKVDLSQPLVATCGSGVTACHVALGAYLCGKPDVPIYDGSWVEWYMRARPEEVISEGRGKTH